MAADTVLMYTRSQVEDRGHRDTHLCTPDAGAVIEKGPCLADLVDVSHIPDVETVVVVNTRQLVMVFVQTHGHGVRVACGALLLPSQLAVNHTSHIHTSNCLNMYFNQSRLFIFIIL